MSGADSGSALKFVFFKKAPTFGVTAASPNPHSQSHLSGSALTHPPGHLPAALEREWSAGRRASTRRLGLRGGGRRESPTLPTGVKKTIYLLLRVRLVMGRSSVLGVSNALRLTVNEKMAVKGPSPPRWNLPQQYLGVEDLTRL